MPIFRHRSEFDHPVEELFGWHRRPGAFERLSPPWEEVRVRARSGEGLHAGSRVTLELRKGPAALTWEVEHTQFEENRLFVDEQRAGPFQRWRHEHRFEALPGGRSALEDVVEWELPLGRLGEAFGGGYVEESLRRLFTFRGIRLADDLALHRRSTAAPRRTIAVTGASGMIGTQLTHLLTTGGHTVRPIVRRSGVPDAIRWDPVQGVLEPGDLEGVDAVVHLAGEPIVGARWTESKKRAILESREAGTRTLTRALARMSRPPEVLVSSSAIGLYGDRGAELLTEGSSPGAGFLSEVTQRWEAATLPARSAGIRTVLLRTGIVLSPGGGVLGTVLLPFRMGVGGRLGRGSQFMSWIDLDDHLRMIIHAIEAREVAGPMNATAPNPVPNAAFTDILGRVLRRPTLLPVPALALRTLLGEMGDELLLQGQRVLPEVALRSGFTFLRPDLEDCLRFQLGRWEG
jgi:uncharacterized protein